MIPFLELKQVTAAHAEEIHEAVRRVIDSGWYLQGEENAQFEREYADYIGAKHCIGVANGLDALNWIFRGYLELGTLQPGDEIIDAELLCLSPKYFGSIIKEHTGVSASEWISR